MLVAAWICFGLLCCGLSLGRVGVGVVNHLRKFRVASAPTSIDDHHLIGKSNTKNGQLRPSLSLIPSPYRLSKSATTS
jgi:hypothetical protein